MIDFQLDPASVEAVDGYIVGLRERILQGIRVGMKEAMVELAVTEADKLHGNPIQSRTGALLAAVLESPRVIETESTIRGMVSSAVGARPLGAWLEAGVHEPALTGVLLHFTALDGTEVFTRGHRQFYEMGKPFQIPSLEESKQKIFETIRASVLEAAGE